MNAAPLLPLKSSDGQQTLPNLNANSAAALELGHGFGVSRGGAGGMTGTRGAVGAGTAWAPGAILVLRLPVCCPKHRRCPAGGNHQGIAGSCLH